MSDTDTVVFWDSEGVEILSIFSSEVDSSVLVDIFDTSANRLAILVKTGRLVDNTSEESSATS